MASIDGLHAILDKAHEGITPKQLMSLPPSALAGVTDSDAKKLKEGFRHRYDRGTGDVQILFVGTGSPYPCKD